MIIKMILLSLAGQKFSSSVEQIRHILAAPDIFPMVCLRRGISGIFLYEDEPVPVLDLKELPEFDLKKLKDDGEYLIVFQSDYGNVGLPVDSAVTIVNAEDGWFENVAPVEEEDLGDQIFCFQGASYKLLNLNEMLAHLTDQIDVLE